MSVRNVASGWFRSTVLLPRSCRAGLRAGGVSPHTPEGRQPVGGGAAAHGLLHICANTSRLLLVASVALVAACSLNGPPTPQTGPEFGNPSDGANEQQPRQGPAAGQPRRIALLLPLGAEGQTQAIAASLRQAAELALFELQGSNLSLIVKDTEGTPEGATLAASSAIDAGAEIIVGPLFAAATKAASTVAQARGVPIISLSSDQSAAGPGVHLLSFQPHQEVGRVVDYATRQGARRFAALIPKSSYGDVVETAFRGAVASAGGTIVRSERYQPGANSMLETSQALFEAVSGRGEQAPLAVDAIFIPGDASTLPAIAPILRYTGIDGANMRLLGTGGWDFRELGQTRSFVGGLYAAPDPAAWAQFTERFAAAYGSAPPRVATLAYDAMQIVAAIARQLGTGQRFEISMLRRPAGFAGVDGPVRFLANGLTERGLAILEVQDFGAMVRERAPAGFNTLGAHTDAGSGRL